MSRALVNLGLACVCLESVLFVERANATWHEFAFLRSTPVQQQKESTRIKEPAPVLPPQATNTQKAAEFPAQSANRQKAAQYLQEQRTAAQQTEAAELELKQDIANLQQLRSRYPNSADLDRAIANLEALLEKVVQAASQMQQPPAGRIGGSQHSAVVSDASVSLLAFQSDRSKQLAAEAQANAAQASQIANVTIANLNRSSAASDRPRQPTPPAHQPPVALPSEEPKVLPEPDRSPASAQPEHAPPPQAADRSPASAPPEQAPPQSSPPPAPLPTATPAPAPNGSAETQWFNKLKNGLIQYSVPQTMLWKVPSTVTVQVSGENAAAAGPIDNQTGEGSLKVARRMKVLVSAPDNPDEFTIAPEADTQLEQFVPEDGPTTWHFSVTPRYTASAKKLIVQAWVIYDANTQRELPVYKAAVDIHVPGLVECVKRLFEGDPDYWVKYGLPGGAGFIFISGVITGLWKWISKNRKKKTHAPQPAGGG